MTVSLTDLLTRAKAEVELKAQTKAAETKVKTARSAGAKAQATAEHLALTSVLDWTPTHLIFREERWECGCGGAGLNPDGYYVLHEHRRLANTTRLVKQADELPPDVKALPHRVVLHQRKVAVCPACASWAEHGFFRTLEKQQSVLLIAEPLHPSNKFYSEHNSDGAWTRIFTPQLGEQDEASSDNDAMG